MARTFGTAGALKAIPAQAGHFGQGVKYPLEYDAAGRLKLSSGTLLVEESLKSIVLTQPGERVMQPDYGAGRSIFEPIDPDRTRDEIERTIADHEPRIARATIDVRIGVDPSTSEVTVNYTNKGEADERTLTAGFFTGPAIS